jgi:hypothetical protein
MKGGLLPRSHTRQLTKREQRHWHARFLVKPTCEVKVSKKRRCRQPAIPYMTVPWHKWTPDDLPQPKWFCREHAKQLIPRARLRELLQAMVDRKREVRRVAERRKQSEGRAKLRAKDERNSRSKVVSTHSGSRSKKRYGGERVDKTGSRSVRKSSR